MATSSIKKTFYVKDKKAYNKLIKELKNDRPRDTVTESPSLKKGREKLATFVFR